MLRQHSKSNTHLVGYIVLVMTLASFVLVLSACNKAADTSLTGTGKLPNGAVPNDSTSFDQESPNQPTVFGTTGTTIPGSLFQSSTPQSGQVVDPKLSSTATSCIQNGFDPHGQGYPVPQSPYSSVAPTCLDPSLSGNYNLTPDGIFGLGVDAIDRMDDCLGTALNWQTDLDSRIRFEIQCYRQHVLEFLQHAVPWGNEQQQVFQNQDGAMQALLFLLLQEEDKDKR